MQSLFYRLTLVYLHTKFWINFSIHQHSTSRRDHQRNNIFNNIHSIVGSSLTSELIVDSFFESGFYRNWITIPSDLASLAFYPGFR